MPQRLLLEGSDIDALLLRVQAEHGPHARIVHAEQKLVGGVAGFFARRRYELAVQVDDAPEEQDPALTPRSFEELLASADVADGGGAAPPAPSRTSEPTVTPDLPSQRGRRLSTESPQFEHLLHDLMGRVERPPTTPASARPSGPAAPTSRPGGAADALARLGMPTELLPRVLPDDPRTALLDVLAQLPTPAPGRLWGTTVLVGPPELAHRAAAAVLDHTGAAPSQVLATTSTAASAADVAVRASTLCSTEGAALVVVETPATRTSARRAGRLVQGLGLGTVIAVVDATRDVTASREWLAELAAAGRPVDQVAAFDVGEQPAPLSLLRLGPDVGWLDGRAATLGTWAAPCLDRLEAAARA